MHEIAVFETLETPVRWRHALPGYILTSGLTNEVKLTLRHCPEATECSIIPQGSLAITMRRMLAPHVVMADFGSFEIPEDCKELTLNLPLSAKFKRGYYRLHIVRKDEHGVDKAVYNAWIVVDSMVNPLKDQHMEVNSVRAQFADICGDDNRMLDGLEVSVGDIAEAVERCLQQWEATPPRTSKYYGDNFPWPELLRNGVMTMLLQSVCTLLQRNSQEWKAEAVSVNLEQRALYYQNLRNEYLQLWRSGMMQAKNEENQDAFSGFVSYM